MVVADMRQEGRTEYMVDTLKLKGKIIEKGLTIELLAEKMGIDKSTLYRRLSENGDPISIKEADLMAKELTLSRDEAVSIFFSQYVA